VTEFFAPVFQDPEPTLRRLGRPSYLDDPSLHNRRDRLVQIFEACWGELGWTIQKCKKPDDLVAIFSALPGAVWQDEISVFRLPSKHSSAGAALRKIRHELRGLVQPRRAAYEANRLAQERLQSAQWALAQATGDDLRLVRQESEKCQQEAEDAAEQYRRLEETDNRLLAQLKGSEASFARYEFFRCLKSKRYELNPLNLANAAAGLPYMGWRQSMRRSSKSRSICANGLAYQVFRSIRYIVAKANKRTEEVLVAHFRTSIPLLPRRYRLAKTELAEKWFFCERALRAACRAKPHPKSLPFEITKHYFKETQVQTHTDIFLAERARLSLSI
jgi:hypothetical protein